MSRVERDPERGRAAAAKLKALGVKGILIKAAEQGYITQVACKMPECFCPEERGGACHFETVTAGSDWSPTHEHFPLAKKDGGHRTVDNAILAQTASAIASTTPSGLAVGTRAISKGSGKHARKRSAATSRTGRTRRPSRSEERRVGKECRSRWSPYH